MKRKDDKREEKTGQDLKMTRKVVKVQKKIYTPAFLWSPKHETFKPFLLDRSWESRL